jgi:pyrroloquinoline-quinone synthase
VVKDESLGIWDRIEAARRRCDVLEHPFYQRWSAGELTREELARYSGQYRHAVAAVAELSSDVSEALPERPELRSHAVEEAAHVELWDGFVEAVGGDAAAEPTAGTRECVDAWTAETGLVERLGRLYAIESGQPAISRTKREGLISRYGVGDGSGTAYFRVHETRDVEHAAETRALIVELAGRADEEAIFAAAESAFRANWRLLDCV